MVIDKFDIVGSVVGPDEADTELIVHADRPLALTVGDQSMEPVAWRCLHIVQRTRGVELSETAADPAKAREYLFGISMLGSLKRAEEIQ